MTTAPPLVLACVLYANDTGVGIVSACLHPGFVRTSSVIGGRSSTLSYGINFHGLELPGRLAYCKVNMKMKPKNFFKAYENAVEKLDQKWFGTNDSSYHTEIKRSLTPMIVIALVALGIKILKKYLYIEITPLLLMLTAIVFFIWNTVSQTRQNQAAGIKTNYFRKYVIVLILGSIYLYIIDCYDSLWGPLIHFYLPWYDLIPGIIRQMVLNGHFYLPPPGIVEYFQCFLNDPSDFFLFGLDFFAYQLSRLCFIAIWFNHLYSHWRNLSNKKQKTLYVIFSWFSMVVGTQLFGIVMILCYLVYIAFWVIVWIFISMTTGRPAAGRKEYELEDGTKVKEEKSLFGEKSYRGSDGAFYKTSDSGKTFTKD